jgi:hypothetical protein
MKDIMDASLSASDKVTITAKLGELLLRQIGNPDAFMSELMKRYFRIFLAHTAYQDIFKYFSLCRRIMYPSLDEDTKTVITCIMDF